MAPAPAMTEQCRTVAVPRHTPAPRIPCQPPLPPTAMLWNAGDTLTAAPLGSGAKWQCLTGRMFPTWAPAEAPLWGGSYSPCAVGLSSVGGLNYLWGDYGMVRDVICCLKYSEYSLSLDMHTSYEKRACKLLLMCYLHCYCTSHLVNVTQLQHTWETQCEIAAERNQSKCDSRQSQI